MSFLSSFRVELRRILCSRSTWLVILLTVLSPLGGYIYYKPANEIMKNSVYIANPVLAGAIGASWLFAILTLYEADRIRKNRTAEITNCIVSPIRLNIVRTLSLMIAAIISGIIISAVYLPYTAWRLGSVFKLSLYFKCIWIILVPAPVIAITAATALYQLLQRADLSFILFVIFTYFSRNGLAAKSFLLRWLNPILPLLSDDFGNTYVLMMILYNRIFWFFMIAGIWLLSCLCIRRYGKGLAGSLLHNSKFLPVPLTALLMLTGGILLFHYQHFVDHSPLEIDYAAYDDITATKKVSVLSAYTSITPDIRTGKQHGTETFQIKNSSGLAQECAITINPGYRLLRFEANQKPLEYTDLKDDNLGFKHIKFTLPPDKNIELVIEYGGFPKIWSLEETFPGKTEISKDYVFLINRDFAPYIELSGLQKNVADITLPSQLLPVTNGDTTKILKKNNNGTITWRSEGTDSRWHLYAAEYDVKEIKAANTRINFYYSSKHKKAMERANVSASLKEVFDYCTKHYGTFAFIDSSKPFKLVELTAYFGGGFAFNGMSVMDETCFSEEGLKDPLKGASGNEVMAHEITHQWWGLGRMFTGDFGTEWSSEGLTVYTTYRMMKEKYGEKYAKKYYVDVWKKNAEDYFKNYYCRHPKYLKSLPEAYQADIINAQTSVLQYCVMPLKLLKAEKLVGGEENMDKILSQLFTQPANEAEPELSYQEFLDACGLTKEELTLD